ncbi:MAG: hypothetical protein GY950_31050 [bacterium]|nr:hypothetical protein [bacterium]
MRAAAMRSSKPNDSRAAANSIFQKKGDPKGVLGFAHNRPGPAAESRKTIPNEPPDSTMFRDLTTPNLGLKKQTVINRKVGKGPNTKTIAKDKTIQRYYLETDEKAEGYKWIDGAPNLKFVEESQWENVGLSPKSWWKAIYRVKKQGPTIVARGRPVSGIGGWVASHCYLALIDRYGEIRDSLSHDPSNSVGGRDGDPTNHSKGEIRVQSEATPKQWELLKKAFASATSAEYDLHNNNCCHAVFKALSNTALDGGNKGMSFATTLNKTWERVHRRDVGDKSVKKAV